MKKSIISILCIVLLLSFNFIVFAHPGRTDSNGGHTDRSTGTYHYHNSGSGNTSTSTPKPTATSKPTVTPKPVKTPAHINTYSTAKLEQMADKIIENYEGKEGISYISVRENTNKGYEEMLIIAIYYGNPYILSDFPVLVELTIDNIIDIKTFHEVDIASLEIGFNKNENASIFFRCSPLKDIKFVKIT
jgi:hypothetical protein